MWCHARLVRGALLLSSLLALSGLHQRQARLSVGWRIAALLPPTLLAANGAAGLVYIARADSAWQVLNSLSVGVIIFLVLLLLLHLHRRRRHLHFLLSRIDELEEVTHACRQPGDHRSVQVLSALTIILNIAGIVVWVVSFLRIELKHPNYLMKVWVPNSFQGPPWYWVTIATQAFCCIVTTVLMTVFNITLLALMEAVELFQTRLSRFCQEQIRSTRPLNSNSLKMVNGTDTVANSFNITSRFSRLAKKNINQVNVEMLSLDSDVDGIPEGLEVGNVMSPSDAPALDPAEAERCLSLLTELYGSVRRLATDAADLCSVPTFWVHASYTGALLIGSYVTIAHSIAVADGSHVVDFGGYTLVNVLQLYVISWAGSRVVQRGRLLHRTLAEARWPAALSPAARFSAQLLLEQTRQPASFDGCGVFVVQKANLLSLLGFVLTYFIIMLQMEVAI